MNYNESVITMYEAKEDIVVLGLTGRTGAGCTTVAGILSKDFKELPLEYQERSEDVKSDYYKFNIIKDYISHDRWQPFVCIKGTSVILSFVIERAKSYENLIEFLKSLQKDEKKSSTRFHIDNFSDLEKDLKGAKYIFNDYEKYTNKELKRILMDRDKEEVEATYKYYIETLVIYKNRLKQILKKYRCSVTVKHELQDEPTLRYDLYTYLFQIFGNNIRKSGDPFKSTVDQKKFYSLAIRMDDWIQLISLYNEVHQEDPLQKRTRICIDAIRNSFESQYLKEHHRAYYLLSISTNEEDRGKQLEGLNIDERTNIDRVESDSNISSSEKFYRQDINACFEIADIHIFNERNNDKKTPFAFVTYQLVKYICLMIHPGLINPTRLEHCMQQAYNAKLNSGCISRQVGAVVTDQNYSIKSVGWNDIPQGQLSCNIRDIIECNKRTQGECFSQYERIDPQFRAAISQICSTLDTNVLCGRKYSYCFKDIHNGITKKSNQIHTRALHAEENAFLQISKYGGQGIENGILFSTANPCELCSKKAYQLGIREIYYIDPYPGISQQHILSFGIKNNRNPKMKKFYGAIGEAYISLYRPLLPYKDELQLITDVNPKKIINMDSNRSTDLKITDIKYEFVEFTCLFISRHEIEAIRHVKFEILSEDCEIDHLERVFTWTGSSYSETKLVSPTDKYSLIDSNSECSPYHYTINFYLDENDKRVLKKGDTVEYTIITKCNDESELMHAYVSHTVKNPCEKLTIKVIFPENGNFADNFRSLRTVDKEMEILHEDKYNLGSKFENTNTPEDKVEIEYTITDPAINYTYGIKWDWKDSYST